MNRLRPAKINPKDTIAIASPSDSFRSYSSIKVPAQDRLEKELEIEITYTPNCSSEGSYNSSSVAERVQDLMDSFSNKDIKGILSATGGYNSNELLPYINWQTIINNPKMFIGSSDITALLNAIYAKTGLITIYGPNFYKFGMKINLEYTLDYLKKCVMEESEYSILPSIRWSNDRWYLNQEERIFHDNLGFLVCSEGEATGTIIGGNLCSLNLLQGTEFMPDLKDVILFVEDDDLAGESCFGEFKRNLHSFLQQSSAKGIKGIVVGRFPEKSEMTEEKIRYILSNELPIKNIPILANVDFGHTDPSISFPIGGTANINVQSNKCEIKISF